MDLLSAIQICNGPLIKPWHECHQFQHYLNIFNFYVSVSWLVCPKELRRQGDIYYVYKDDHRDLFTLDDRITLAFGLGIQIKWLMFQI